MVSCRICLEDLKKPVSLPCGHIFCSGCIVKTVQAVKPYSHLHPCPICRSIYNIAPINFSIVPPNLRPFVTPSVRKLYIDNQLPQDEKEDEDVKETLERDAKESPEAPTSSSSEIQRLRAENIALRNNCYMWRKRAEMHGTANLGLLNFARVVRDQASLLARERDELQNRCHSLKRKIEDIQMYPDLEPIDSFLQERSKSHVLHGDSSSPHPDSLLFAPHPVQIFNSRPQIMPGQQFGHRNRIDEPSASTSSSNSSGLERPHKKTKIDDSQPTASFAKVDPFRAIGSVVSKIAARQRDAHHQSELRVDD